MSRSLRPIPSILAEAILWLRPNRTVIVSVVLGFGAGYFLISPTLTLFGCKERDFRAAGWLLQFLGFFLAALGLLKDAISDAGFAPLNWWAKRPSLFRKSFSVELGTGLFTVTGGTVSSWIATAADSPIERRIEVIESNIKTLRGLQQEMAQHVSANQSEVRKEIARLDTTFDRSNSSLQSELVAIRSGRAHVNLFGVVLFMLGTFVATASPELSSFVGQPMSCNEPLFSNKH